MRQPLDKTEGGVESSGIGAGTGADGVNGKGGVVGSEGRRGGLWTDGLRSGDVGASLEPSDFIELGEARKFFTNRR